MFWPGSTLNAVSHPYRTPPRESLARQTDRNRLRVATFAFGFLCVIAGAAFSGVDRAKCALLGTLGGVVAMISRPQVC